MRKIKVGVLGVSGLVYRIHVIIVQSIFFYVITGQWKWAISTSIIWNLLNTLLYYNYHFWFAKMFVLGKGTEK